MRWTAFFLSAVLLFGTPVQSTEYVKPKVYILSIGVDNQAKEEDNFAAETKILADAMVKCLGSIYRVSDHRLIGKEQATRENCLKAVADIPSSVDFVIVYIGMHGNIKDDGFRCYPADKPIKSKELIALLPKSKMLFLIMDACHSEGMIDDWKDHDDSVVIMAACKKEENAFTWCTSTVLTEALQGYADYNEDNVITLDEVLKYSKARMEEIWPKQHIVTTKPGKNKKLALSSVGTAN